MSAYDGKTVLLILFPYVNNLYLNLETMQACRQNYLEDNQAPSKIAYTVLAMPTGNCHNELLCDQKQKVSFS
jgi:hypothetical protein